MLRFYDSSQQLYGSDPLRTVHDGQPGGAHEVLFYLRNDDVTTYYENVSVGYRSDEYDSSGEYASTGWGIKFMYGERRPTEAEWAQVASGSSVMINDIGSTVAADTFTYHPVWVRVYCPGQSRSQLRGNQNIVVLAYEKKVGA
jgi:hypothetical protein